MQKALLKSNKKDVKNKHGISFGGRDVDSETGTNINIQGKHLRPKRAAILNRSSPS